MKRTAVLAGLAAACLAAAPCATGQQIAQTKTMAPAKQTVQPWMILAAIEANRPVFTLRDLTPNERTELTGLSTAYAGAGKTTATLSRLIELGQTGDREAMLAVRGALTFGAPRDVLAAYADTQETRDFHTTLTRVLAALWTAHIWKLHGVEAAGIPYMDACVNGLRDVSGNPSYGYFKPYKPDPRISPDHSVFYGNGSSDRALGCGFHLVITSGQFYVPSGKQHFQVWRRDRGTPERAPAADFYITDVLFYPVWGDGTFVEEKFQKHLANLREGYPYVSLDAPKALFDPSQSTAPEFQLSRLFYYGYAERTGRRADLDLARDDGMAKNAKMYADMRREREAAAARDREQRARDVALWDELMALAKSGQTSPRLVDLQSVSQRLGGTYLDAYYALPAQQQELTATNQGASGYSGGYNPSQSVEVRTYDSSGTYTGSTTTSAFWADVMKMTSAVQR